MWVEVADGDLGKGSLLERRGRQDGGLGQPSDTPQRRRVRRRPSKEGQESPEAADVMGRLAGNRYWTDALVTIAEILGGVMDKDNAGRVRLDPICKVRDDGLLDVQDPVVVERPLEIFVGGRRLYSCLHTPGDEVPLALALCYQDGIITAPGDARTVVLETEAKADCVRIELAGVQAGLAEMERRVITSSKAGIPWPGRSRLRQRESEPLATAGVIAYARMFVIREEFLERQTLFHLTGATHAVALYDADGVCLASAEDVARHNALDKCMGKVLLAGTLKRVFLAMLSSRVSYEMMFKLCLFGVPVVAGFSAPTSMAVDLARATNITLVGFLRKGRLNIYSQPARIDLPAPS